MFATEQIIMPFKNQELFDKVKVQVMSATKWNNRTPIYEVRGEKHIVEFYVSSPEFNQVDRPLFLVALDLETLEVASVYLEFWKDGARTPETIFFGDEIKELYYQAVLKPRRHPQTGPRSNLVI